MKKSLKNLPTKRAALVLLSGGLDSVAALHHALKTYDEVEAISFMYGQPHLREVDVANTIAKRRGVPMTVLHLGESVRGHHAIKAPENGVDRNHVSRANLAGRNLIFLAVAGAHAARRWPGRLVHLVIGCNLNDAAAFPDCRHPFMEQAAGAVDMGLRGIAGIRIDAPWQLKSKAEIVAWCASRPEAMADVRDSLSCYRGTRCGECDACRLRASAFGEAQTADGTGLTVPVCGGDAHRVETHS